MCVLLVRYLALVVVDVGASVSVYVFMSEFLVFWNPSGIDFAASGVVVGTRVMKGLVLYENGDRL